MNTLNRRFSAAAAAAFIAAAYDMYAKLSAADFFLYVFQVENDVYAVELPTIPREWIKHSCTSSGDIRAVVKPSKNAIDRIQSHAFFIGRYETIYSGFEKRFYEINGRIPAQRNNGLAYEYGIYAYYGMAEKWRHNSTPFFVAGDIEIDGRQVQIKSFGACLMTGTQLNRLQAHARE